jgi:hypothetical protein
LILRFLDPFTTKTSIREIKPSKMKWFGTFAALAVLEPVLAIIDPTASGTPCVPSRTITDAAIQTVSPQKIE